MKSLPVLSIAIEGIAPPSNDDAKTLLLVVRELVEHCDALSRRIAALEAETRKLRGEA
jgi:hypothetical protein